jgi:hypothetical protein
MIDEMCHELATYPVKYMMHRRSRLVVRFTAMLSEKERSNNKSNRMDAILLA